MTSVILEDQAGNTDFIGSAELAALGIGATVEVTSPGDVTPPVLTGVSVAPQQINTVESSQSVQVTKSASDDLSGVAFSGNRCTGFTNGLVFTSPSGTVEVKINNCAFSLVAGSETSGDFSAMATFPQFSQKGIWRLTSVILEDQAGNTDFIGSAELAALGISATVEVTFNVINLNDSGPGSLRQAILKANDNPGEVTSIGV